MKMSSPSETNRYRVVAHFKGGKLLKGFTEDFSPARQSFRLVSERREDEGTVHDIRISHLKAVFFVKNLDGNILYKEKKKFREVSTSHLKGLRIQLHFKDGETIRGATTDYNGGKQGFFVSPVDPKSNNSLIFVVADAVEDIRLAGDVCDDPETVHHGRQNSEPIWT
jgi:hypothetical protein